MKKYYLVISILCYIATLYIFFILKETEAIWFLVLSLHYYSSYKIEKLREEK